ncbi:hypothetical protein SS50377_20772 [Spironucleus salmonicida]|uniref:Transmembrane protein n=1 Tax=Spironucleus salmonicida TaxID=348837 RepID=V6M1N6_9EUKA|nr:hypothetical protein SS50377_20772 [Spironucleus salmonicida]|eukprot:EST47119.1 Hypothetical protein SS50377_12828 [Spironucleus salmonicida]
MLTLMLSQLIEFNPKDFSAYPSKLVIYHNENLSEHILKQFYQKSPLPFLSINCAFYDLFCARQNISVFPKVLLYVHKNITELSFNDKIFEGSLQIYLASPKNFFERFADKSIEYNQVQLSAGIGCTVALIFGPCFYFYARYFGTKKQDVHVETFEDRQRRHEEYFKQEREMQNQGVKVDLKDCFINKVQLEERTDIKKNE